jgi:hypothetical protein
VQDHALEAEADRLGRMASMSRAHEIGAGASGQFPDRNSGTAQLCPAKIPICRVPRQNGDRPSYQ